jgi:CheY-like chemotaxis protein
VPIEPFASSHHPGTLIPLVYVSICFEKDSLVADDPLVLSDRSGGGRKTETAETRTAEFARRRVLVVDDVRGAAYLLTKLLELLGQDVDSANCGTVALEKARAQPPDLVISDLTMPGMSGYELAKEMRADPLIQQATLVALSGRDQESEVLFADSGFDFYLCKPVGVEDLKGLLRSTCKSSTT